VISNYALTERSERGRSKVILRCNYISLRNAKVKESRIDRRGMMRIQGIELVHGNATNPDFRGKNGTPQFTLVRSQVRNVLRH
jgi:hypothetical protein